MNYISYFIFFLFIIAHDSTINAESPTIINGSQNINTEYVDQDKKFAISYPKDWDKRVVQEFGIDILVLVPPEKEEGLIHERMTIIYSKVEGVETLEKFVSASIDHLGEVIADFKVEETTDVQLQNVKAKRVIYGDVAGQYKLKFMQYFVLYKDRLYILTCSADAPEFDIYKSSFEKIAQSFRVID